MAAKNFPGPNINRLIENDPQIIKVGMDYMGFGSRASMFAKLTGTAAGTNNNGTAPPAGPEMTIKHTS